MGGHRTRRDFLKTGLGLLGAVPFARWTRLLDPPRTPPLRCVTLGANGVIEPGSSQDYRNCRALLLETRTSWVRIWADWPSLQPEGELTPDTGGGAWRLRELDRQIAQANRDGVSVILTSYRFPTWASGAPAAEDTLYQPEDRMAALDYSGSPKDVLFRIPPDVGPGSAWARWIEFLVRRYSSGAAQVAALELVNEPNTQLWPLQGPSATSDPYDEGPVTVHQTVAQMFGTANAIAAGSPLILMGPATSDTTAESRLAVPYDTFTRLLLDELHRIGFAPGPNFAWTQHNYTDVEYDQGDGSLTSRATTHAAATRRMLTGRWSGWPDGDPAAPTLLIPEGGARLTKIAEIYGTPNPDRVRARQAELIRRNATRMADEAGVAMIGQYLFYSDPNFDCGLCEVGGARRPAYATWRALPT